MTQITTTSIPSTEISVAYLLTEVTGLTDLTNHNIERIMAETGCDVIAF